MVKSRIILGLLSTVLIVTALPAQAEDRVGNTPSVVVPAAQGFNNINLFTSGNSNVMVFENSSDNDIQQSTIVAKKRSGNNWLPMGQISYRDLDVTGVDDFYPLGISYDGQHVLVEIDHGSVWTFCVYDYVLDEGTYIWRRTLIEDLTSTYIEAPIAFHTSLDITFAGKSNRIVFSQTVADVSNAPLLDAFYAIWNPTSKNWGNLTTIRHGSNAQWGWGIRSNSDGTRVIACERNLISGHWSLDEYSLLTDPPTVTNVYESDSDAKCVFNTASSSLTTLNFQTRTNDLIPLNAFHLVVKTGNTWSAPVDTEQKGLASFDAEGNNAIVPMSDESVAYTSVDSTGFHKIADFISPSSDVAVDQYVSGSETKNYISPDGLWLASVFGSSGFNVPNVRVGRVKGQTIISQTVSDLNPNTPGSDNFTLIPSTGKILFSGNSAGKWSVLQLGVSTDVSSASVVITGKARKLQTLTAHPRSTSIPTATYTYTWLRCKNRNTARVGLKCSIIKGATRSTYKVTRSDVGKYLSVRVKATTPSNSVTKTSLATAKIGSK